MASPKTIVVLFALTAVFAVAFAQALNSDSHNQNGRFTRQPIENTGDEEVFPEEIESVENSQSLEEVMQMIRDQETQDAVWTSCNYGVDPYNSCADCNTRVICKPVGGLVLKCNANRPYCNRGICSFVPSAECS